MKRTRGASWFGAVIIAGLVAAACRPGMPVREVLRPTAPYERYAQSLRDAGLADTALGRDWLAAGARALREPVPVTLPFREAAYLAPETPGAVAYRFELRRGQRFAVELTPAAADGSQFFMDAFEIDAFELPDGAPRRVAHADPGSAALIFEPPRDGLYILRVQPELLRGGRFEIVQQVAASLRFPVTGADSRAVVSHFGAPRDGGTRAHHGVDVFAPRGTPVISASDGWVSGVQTTPRGGNVVWVWDAARGASLYYAHLDQQHVGAGQRVTAGEQIGTVGNTGNARGTAPHLHFGIYVRGHGPVDPYPFVHDPRARPPAVAASVEPLGSARRTTPVRVRLRAGAAAGASLVAELPRHTVVTVEAAMADAYRVSLPDGRRGYLRAAATQPLRAPLRQHRAGETTVVRQHPQPLAAPVDSLEAGAGVPVLGRYEGYLFVRTPEGREGWVVGD